MWLRIAEELLLTASVALPALALLYRPRLFPRLRTRRLFLACCAVVYVLVLARVQLIDMRLDQELLAFDLDGDDSFSPEEETPAQQAAMARVIGDTARNFAPVTGLILSPLLVTTAFGIVVLVTRTGRALARRFTRTS